MVSRNDLILILTELQEEGIDTTEQMRKVFTSSEFPVDVIRFINENREMDINKFYTHIRKSYNQKKSKLYINIMKEIEDTNDVLTTLASLNLQIILFSKGVSDRQLFLNHARSEEISKVLALYFQTYDLTNCIKLLRLIKADISAFEYVAGRRSA